jgi:hypothetical protein
MDGFDLTSDLLAGQDPKGLVMCFFKHSDRVRICSIRLDGLDRGGRSIGPELILKRAAPPRKLAELLCGARSRPNRLDRQRADGRT